MPSCCQSSGRCEGANRFFSRFSKRYAKQFRRKGLEKIQKHLLEGVRLEPVEGRRILDIGCGVGALHLTLLQEGASHAVGIDAAEGMIERARQFARELGLAGKAEHVLGDFVEHTDSIREADITLMDKVLCCYADVESLVRSAAAKTQSILAITHPHDHFFVRSFCKCEIAVLKFFNAKFHPFWHDWNMVDAMIRSLDFQPVYSTATFVWEARVYRRG